MRALLARPDAPGRFWDFRQPSRVLEARTLDEVAPLIEELEAAAEAGLHAVGFLSYEAAPAFEPRFEVHSSVPEGPPLAWWALFDAPVERSLAELEAALEMAPTGSTAAGGKLEWRPRLGRDAYVAAIDEIHARIAAGDTYQANFTFPLDTATPPDFDPLAFFLGLVRAQRGTRDAAYVDTGRLAICSASPELFLELDGDLLISKPMKGTARRGRFPAEDAAAREVLLGSVKDRAENVMIVDMVRNDLGRVARTGTVEVDKLCAVETYPTVHQLVSTVTARSDASLLEILRALYPAASITGAPKIRTGEILRGLEIAPRGVYTGAVGRIGPGRRARLNVAIRTAVVDRAAGTARYDVGGGIVWDSRAEAEYDECRAKALLLGTSSEPFELLETLLWRPRQGSRTGGGFFLLDRHLERLAASARYFDRPCDLGAVRARLDAAVDGRGERCRVRLRVGEDGAIEVDVDAFPCAGRQRWTARLDDRPIDDRDVFLFHKTTRRRIYDAAAARFPEVDEVLLWNARGELTESTRANLVLRFGARRLTPPVDAGLLAGTYRAELLERGRLVEERLPIEALDAADEVFLVNSLRGWIRVEKAAGEIPEPETRRAGNLDPEAS